MRKEGRDEENRSSQESPQQAGESETTLQCISKERAEDVTQDSQGEASTSVDVLVNSCVRSLNSSGSGL